MFQSYEITASMFWNIVFMRSLVDQVQAGGEAGGRVSYGLRYGDYLGYP